MESPSIAKKPSLIKQDGWVRLQRVTGPDTVAKFLVKMPVSDYPSPELIALLEREYHLVEALALDCMAKPVEFRTRENTCQSVFEDFGGVPLSSDSISGREGLEAFRDIAGKLCAILESVHGRGLVLYGLNSQAILRNPITGEMRLIDALFAQPPAAGASRLKHLSAGLHLGYAAPELVGLADAPLDYRADLYSLGVIFYEILTGVLPFQRDDPAELIQCHLAKQPVFPEDPRQEIPPELACAVLRLLSKQPADRSEYGFSIMGEIDGSLGRGKNGSVAPTDGRAPPKPPSCLPDAIYGRSTELARIQARLEKAGPGKPELILLEGEPGMGKTALIDDVRRRLDASRYLSFAGKFVRSPGGLPLSGWISALSDLANQILLVKPLELEARRKEINEALRDLAPLISAWVPEWKIILASPLPWRESGRDPSHAMISLATHKLMKCFSNPERRLVLFLDDLQWADASSLHILKLIFDAPEPLNLSVIGTVRSLETEGAGFAGGQGGYGEALRAIGEPKERIHLAPLGGRDVGSWIRDALGHEVVDAEGLSRLVLLKTGGNPFFTREFLKSLLTNDFFAFSTAADGWEWDRARFEAMPSTENVISFLSRRIVGLAGEIKAAVACAAWLGTEFDLPTFCQLAGCASGPARRDLEAAVSESILSINFPDGDPGSTVYRFVHDRILDACLALTPESERLAWQLRLGTVLMRAEDPSKRASIAIFKAVHHLDAAGTLIQDRQERYAIAQLGLTAGKRARHLGAFIQALGYFEAGLRFLAPAHGPQATGSAGEFWLAKRELAMTLHEEAAETACISGQIDRAEFLCRAILERAGPLLEQSRVFEIRIAARKAQKDFPAAVDLALEILAKLGMKFPLRPRKLHAVLGFLRTRMRIPSDRIHSLIDLPPMENPRAKAAARIIQSIYSAAYLARPELFPLLISRHVYLSLKYGNEPYSAATYLGHAIVLSAVGDIENAYRLGEVALKLPVRLNAPHLMSQIHMGFYAFVFPWKRHLRESLPFVMEGYQSGMENGDFEFASYLANQNYLVRLHSGFPLDQVEAEFARNKEKMHFLGQERSIHLQNLLMQFVADLRAWPAHGAVLQGPFYQEAEMLPIHFAPLDQNMVFQHFLAKVILGHVLGDNDAAHQAAIRCRKHLDGAFGIYLNAIFLFYESLVFLALEAGPGKGNRSRSRRVAANQKQMKAWSGHAPMNFLHKYHLVEAERSRFAGRNERAARHFETAIGLSQTHGYLQETAQAQEKAALFYFGLGMERIGRYHLREAHHSYQLWGCAAKVGRLESLFQEHLAFHSVVASPHSSLPLSQLQSAVDYLGVLKSSQAISSEIRLPKLLERLMRIMLEHAGSQRGYLILAVGGRFFLEAKADIEDERVSMFDSRLLEEGASLSLAVVNYVARTEKAVVIVDGGQGGLFEKDPYIASRQSGCSFCAPLVAQGKLLGLVYLENDRMNVFTAQRLDILNLLCGQAAISIANARYHALQMEAQQAKINPHFLFNALSSIANLTLDDPKTAEVAIVKLSNLYRYILTSSESLLVTLDQELEVVKSYLLLEKLRFGAKLDFAITTRGDTTRVKLPGMLIQPLVENSIRHGIAPKMEPGKVTVSAEVAEGRCQIIVQDDGEAGSKASSGTGFGLRSVQERLELTYGGDYKLDIAQTNGFRVEIGIPILDGP